MRAWGVVTALLLSLVTACGSSTSTMRAPAVRTATTTQDPTTTECGSLLSDAATATGRLLSYDYRDLPASLAALRAVTTETEYARESGDRIKVVDPLATRNHAVMTATSLATGYVDGGCSQPRVLAFAQTSATNTESPTATTNAIELLLTLTPVDGHYLVADVAEPTGGITAGSSLPDCPSAPGAAVMIASLSASYDYRRLDAQFPAIAADLTGTALAQFQQREASLRSALTSGDTVTTATVLASEYVGGGCAAPTFFVGLSVAYVRAAGSPQTEMELLKIALRPNGSGWLASDVTPYGTGSS